MSDARFNPPPGWPPPPSPDWRPPAGWLSSARWPIPDGWPLWVDEEGNAIAGPEPTGATKAGRPARRTSGWVWLTSGVAAVVGLLIGMMIMMPQGQDRTAQPLANPTIPVPAATVTTEITRRATITETQKITAPPQTREVTATVRSTRTVSAAPRPRITVTKTVTQAPEDFDGRSGGDEDEDGGEGEGDESTYYRNCSAARAAGAAPLHIGDPGYGPHLDRDGDGVACES